MIAATQMRPGNVIKHEGDGLLVGITGIASIEVGREAGQDQLTSQLLRPVILLLFKFSLD